MMRSLLLALVAAASVVPAQSTPFTLTGPTLIDFSVLPRTASGAWLVRFTGTGFVSPMWLVATIGPVGPMLIPHMFVDAQTIEVEIQSPASGAAAFELYKLDNNGLLLSTPRLDAQFVLGPNPFRPPVYVATNGSDSNPGTQSAPFRTIDRGIQALAPGVTLYLRGGTYHERPVVNRSGTAFEPITIRSFPGEQAVIDSGPTAFRTPGNTDWEVVEIEDGICEYQSVMPVPVGTPYGYIAGIPGYENVRVGLVPYTSAAAFRSKSEAYLDPTTQFYVGPGMYRDPVTGRLHVRLQKTADMRSVEARYGQVLAGPKPDPRDYSILVSQAPSTLEVRGSHVVIRDLTVHQALRSIWLPSTVTDVRIEGVEVWLGDSAIESSGAGSSGIVVTRCRVYGDVPRWIFWTDAKEPPAPADKMRQTSIDFFNAAHDVEISYNHVRGGHDLVGVNTDEDRFAIHHNVLMNCHDDAVELEGTIDIGRIELYDNYVVNALVAVSPGQDTPLTRGPILIHNNVFADLRTPPINRRPGIVSWNGGGRFGFEYMLKQHSGNTFYYHNTMVQLDHSGLGINLTPARPAGSWCFNNILVMVNGKVNGSYRTGPVQLVDGNLYWKRNTVDGAPLADQSNTIAQLFAATGFEQHGLGSVPRRGTNPQFAGFQLNVVDPTQPSWAIDVASEQHPISAFFLSGGSPAIGAAVLVPVHPLFGLLPGAYASRDLGAIPAGGAGGVYTAFPFDQVQ